MQIGVLADIHGNRVALDAVLDDMPPVDKLVCVGDVIGYNPWPHECVQRLRDRDVPTVAGNHDRSLTNPDAYAHYPMAYAGLKRAQQMLTDTQQDWLQNLPDTRHLANGDVKLVHSHPTNQGEYVYPEDFPDLAPHLGTESILLLGHTHIQSHRIVDQTLVVNPGSVGQPRDGDPRAAYSIVDTDAFTVAECRVSYDIAAVQHELDRLDMPPKTGYRLIKGK